MPTLNAPCWPPAPSTGWWRTVPNSTAANRGGWPGSATFTIFFLIVPRAELGDDPALSVHIADA